MNIKTVAGLTLGLVIGLFAVSPVSAYTIPSFSSCSAPSGSLMVSYSSGSHWIPVESFLREGSDSVYSLTDNTNLQCYCDLSGNGIQTEWWKISDLSQGDKDTLVSQGWIYVGNGADFGLSAAPYLARNSNYTCAGKKDDGFSPPGPGSPPVCDSARPIPPELISVVRKGTSATLTWKAVSNATHYSIIYGNEPNKYIYGVANTGNVTTFTVNALDLNTKYYFAVIAVNDCMPSLPSGNAGQVLGVSTLASTGDSVVVTSLFVFAALMIVLSVSSYRKNRGI